MLTLLKFFGLMMKQTKKMEIETCWKRYFISKFMYLKQEINCISSGKLKFRITDDIL